MRKLIKKILREDDFQWMKDIKPNFFQALQYHTQDDPLINVKYNYEYEFYEIRDDNSALYYDDWDLDRHFTEEYMVNLTKDDPKYIQKCFLAFIRETMNGLEKWSKDYHDFQHLYQTVKNLF